jgi:hypothetical protein
LRKSDKWDIDSDVTLLTFMKGFKERLFTKMDGVKKQLDQIVYETKSTEVSLFNKFNEFLNLSNTQFVENVRMKMYSSIENSRGGGEET